MGHLTVSSQPVIILKLLMVISEWKNEKNIKEGCLTEKRGLLEWSNYSLNACLLDSSHSSKILGDPLRIFDTFDHSAVFHVPTKVLELEH